MMRSSTTHHSPNLMSLLNILGLIPCRIMALMCSTYPFVRGCATVTQSTRMWYSSQNLKNFFLVNCVLLLVMMEFGTPNRWLISRKKSTTCSDLILVIGHASIHLENLSTTTSKWV
jgi:hypothetical protein